jgi:amino acid transporter
VAHDAHGAEDEHRPRLSWKEGLYLVGPDPLTSPYYSSGALIVAGVGYATPLFQIGLYVLLFLLAPLYIEAVLLTLSNGGTYVMTRYSMSRFGAWAVGAAALVGIIISFSYVATAIVSLLSYGNYVRSLVADVDGPRTLLALLLSCLPAAGFGIWVVPSEWRRVTLTVVATFLVAALLTTVLPAGAVVMLPPLVMLFTLNNRGLKESVKVSKTIFLVNAGVMGLLILSGIVYAFVIGADLSRLVDGARVPASAAAHADAHAEIPAFLPGLAALGAPLLLAGLGSSILGATGVESVMNIPEDLARPRRDVARIYRWMLSILLVIGGSVSVLVFLVLPPAELATKSHYLLAALGYRSVEGLTGSSAVAGAWQTIIVANAGLMLIGATNTGFAGARGLWMTMARDNLLPRLLLDRNARGAFDRIHLLMLGAIFLLALEADWNLPKLERWYGATFGLVMFSGMVAFILLRKFKAKDRRIYTAPWNVTIGGVRLPAAALLGLAVLGYALLSMYATYRGEIGELRTLVITVGAVVALVLVMHNHRPLIRVAWGYFHRVIETVPSTEIESADRTAVVAVHGMRTGRLLTKSVALARAQSRATGIPYRQLVVFHMSDGVREEHVYRVQRDSIRPSGIDANAIRVFTELTELAPADMTCYLALVPRPRADPNQDSLHAAMDALVEFHERHNFRGHMVLIGTYGVTDADIASLQDRLEGSTLVPVPVFGEE